MPPKAQQKGKQTGTYKAGTLLKDILPPSIKNPPREGKQLKVPEATSQNIVRQKYFEEFQELEEWPGDEQALNFNFDIESHNVFNDNSEKSLNKLLTNSFLQDKEQVYWRRPVDFNKTEEEENKQYQQGVKYRRRLSMNMKIENHEDLHGKTHGYDDSYHHKKSKELDSDSVQQVQQVKKDPENIKLTVFEIFDRDESQEEYEVRKKELEAKLLLEKKGAKKGKKEEVVDEGPLKLKDVKLSNIDLSYLLCSDSKWIASQLQLIKDKNIKDCNSNKPIWSRIYPQQEGVPVFNNSGRYWVKLNYMGKEKKIEIDDKMPVNYKGQCKFPKSVKKEEIWTFLITKAILKLLYLVDNVNKVDNLTGSGFVMYALTGLISETISLQQNVQQQNERFDFLKSLLTDEHYQADDVILSCYCKPDHLPVSESNIKRNEKEFYIDKLRKSDNDDQNNNSQQQGNQDEQQEEEKKQNQFSWKQKSQKNTLDSDNVNLESPTKVKKHSNLDENKQKKPSLSQKPTFVIPGFAYPVIESFFNQNFNMVYVQKRSDKEIRLRQEYFNLSKVSMHKMSKDEKLEHRRKKKELKEKISEEDKKRIDLITKPPIQYKLFRLKTNVGKVPNLNIYCPYSNTEITTAKMCILNKLSKPPNYELPEIRDDGKSVISTAQKGQDESFTMKPLEDFSSLPHLKEIVSRGNGGFWVQDQDFKGCFQFIQIFYNPQKLKYTKNILIPHNPDYELTHNNDHELLIVEKNENLPQDQELRVVFGFQPKNAKGEKITPSPYCILQKFDFGQWDSIHNYPVLQDKQQSQMFYIKNQNSVFRINAYSPVTYSILVSSDSQFRTCSITDYLTEYEDYKQKNFTIEYPAFEADKYQTLFRFRIQPNESNNNVFLLKVKSSTDNNMLKYFRLKLIEEPKNNQGYMLNTLEGVNKNLYETTFVIQNYIRLQLKQNTRYYILFEGQVPYPVQEGALDVQLFLKNEQLAVEQIENVEPLEYLDKYVPTKYGILFREKLFISDENLTSFYLKIGEVEQSQQQSNQQQQKGGAISKGKQEILDVQEKELKEKRLIKLELFENDKSVLYSYGYNQVLLSHTNLKKQADKQYYLQATFDRRSWEGCKVASEETSKIYWFLKVISSDTVVILKDTEKEDKEKAIQKQWEEKEQGRAVKAKKARDKFALIQKQKNNQPLTEEELAILNEPRISRKQREEEQNQKGGKQAAKAAKKDDKKQAKGGKGEVVVEKKEERPIPQSQNHNMSQIQYFLEHMEQERVMEELAQHAGLIHVRSQENKREIAEIAQMSNEELVGIFNRNLLLREEMKQYQRDQKQLIKIEVDSQKDFNKQKWDSYIQKREEIQQKLAHQTQKEKELLEICKQEKPTILPDQFEKLIIDAEQIPEINLDLIEVSRKVLKNIKIFTLIDKINNGLQNFEIELLEACVKDIEDYQVKGIDIELIEKAQDMIQESKDNPNFLQEKQAELKKQGKKAKK